MGVTLTEHRKEYACGWWKPYQTPNLGLGPSSTNASPTAPLYPGWWYDVRELVRFRYQGWCSLFDTAAEPSPWHVASERSFYKPLERRLWRRGGQRIEGALRPSKRRGQRADVIGITMGVVADVVNDSDGPKLAQEKGKTTIRNNTSDRESRVVQEPTKPLHRYRGETIGWN